eukprot:14673951-Alexandrium_andersonii.AAC.1
MHRAACSLTAAQQRSAPCRHVLKTALPTPNQTDGSGRAVLSRCGATGREHRLLGRVQAAVSYTHLTLPTICSV